MSKSEDRALRKAEKLAKFEAAKQQMLKQVPLKSGPTIEQLPQDKKHVPMIGVRAAELEVPKQPSLGSNGGRFGWLMTWCSRKRDCEGQWSWGDPRAFSESEMRDVIAPAIDAMQGLEWEDIESQRANGHRLHHAHELADLVGEAQARWTKLGLEQFDTLFRFRAGNLLRAWGYVIRGHFYMVWWDRLHRIYQTKS